MTTTPHKRTRPSLQSIYIHHILWGTVCLVLIGIIIALWYSSQSLNQKTATLEQRLAVIAKPTCTAREPWKAGTTKEFSITTNGGARTFLVNLPADFTPSRYYPALLFFPGKGSSAIGGQQATGLNSLPAVTIYPQPTIGRDNVFSWQGAPYSSGADDVRFVSDILDKVEGQLCIERGRIYAIGMSNGGGFVSLLSCRLSNRIAAFGIVAGAMYYPTGLCRPPQPAPLINIHGDNDGTVPYFGSAARRLPAIDEWMRERAAFNSCNTHPSVTADITSTTTEWKGCRDNATVKNIRLHNTGHIWSPGEPNWLWTFVSKHTL